MPTNRRLVEAGEDFYVTPKLATIKLLSVEIFEGGIWEPACGDGAISNVLLNAGYDVHSTDLYDHSYGQTGVDFLSIYDTPYNIITNPPYSLANDFAKRAIKITHKKVALLLRIAFLEGQKRYKEIYKNTPPDRIHIFSKRLTMYPKNAERKGSGTTAYAWFIWDKRNGNTTLKWI